MNEEYLVGTSQENARATSLLFVHTARRFNQQGRNYKGDG
jgi:hypothetical protein